MKTRRQALLSLAAAGAIPAQAQHEHAGSLPAPLPTAPKYFSGADFRTLAILVDLILPRSETPGASDAGVHFYIDEAAATRPDLRATFRAGLDWLDQEARRAQGQPFAALTGEEQSAILRRASEAAGREEGRFFRTLKDLTIEGFYSSRAGLVEELGWHGNTFVADFQGCTHPEHQE